AQSGDKVVHTPKRWDRCRKC
ncbi:hypothetical protein KIPB_012805, partial [Kipferlia bialata]